MCRKLLVPALSLALLAAISAHARADDEKSSQTMRVVTAKHANAKLTLSFQKSATKPSGGSWSYTWTRRATKRSGVLAKIPVHAHVVAFLPKTGKRFAIVETSAGHRLNDRVFIYQHDGKLIKTFGLKDLFTTAELAKLNGHFSTSHLWWLQESNTPCCRTEHRGDTIVIDNILGPPVRISISRARATR